MVDKVLMLTHHFCCLSTKALGIPFHYPGRKGNTYIIKWNELNQRILLIKLGIAYEFEPGTPVASLQLFTI